MSNNPTKNLGFTNFNNKYKVTSSEQSVRESREQPQLHPLLPLCVLRKSLDYS